MTPLVLASASGQQDVAIFLLDNGADPNARDELGRHRIALCGDERDHRAEPGPLCQLRGAYLPSESDRTLSKHCSRTRPIPMWRSISPCRTAAAGAPAMVGATPYLLAAASPDPEVMRMLASAGADPKTKTKNGLTALMLAAGLGRGQDFTNPEKAIALEAVRIAFDAGVDVNAANEEGLTAMHGAALNGADGVVQFLVSKGAQLDVRDRHQQTPLSIAAGERLPMDTLWRRARRDHPAEHARSASEAGRDAINGAGLFPAAERRKRSLPDQPRSARTGEIALSEAQPQAARAVAQRLLVARRPCRAWSAAGSSSACLRIADMMPALDAGRRRRRRAAAADRRTGADCRRTARCRRGSCSDRAASRRRPASSAASRGNRRACLVWKVLIWIDLLHLLGSPW